MKSSGYNGYIYEHIVVAENFMGRPLREEEVVHHLDENPANNREENLLVLESSQHSKLHAWVNRNNECKAVKTIEKEPTYCPVCEKTLQGQQLIYCSQKCSQQDKYPHPIPTKEDLEQDIKLFPITKIGIKYNVSDNAIRKWLKKHNLPTKRKDIIQYLKNTTV